MRLLQKFNCGIKSIRRGRSVSSEQENSESEQTEKSPLVSAKLETFAKMLFNRANAASQDSLASGGSPKETSSSPTRWLPNLNLLLLLMLFSCFFSLLKFMNPKLYLYLFIHIHIQSKKLNVFWMLCEKKSVCALTVRYTSNSFNLLILLLWSLNIIAKDWCCSTHSFYRTDLANGFSFVSPPKTDIVF